MVSDFRQEGSKNSGDNVFEGLSVGPEENGLVSTYLASHDLATNTCQAIRNDLRKFADWFSQANREPFAVKRITVRDVTDFKDHLRRKQGQAVSTVNRALVTIRRYLAWLGENGHLKSNPAKPVKELRRQQLAQRAWNGMRCGGCFGRLNSGRTCGPEPSSPYSYTRAAGSRTSWPWNFTT